jgi:hypothetical protein
MQDQYTGKSGTFIVDPVLGIRVPIEQYEAKQATNPAVPVATAKAPKLPISEVI